MWVGGGGAGVGSARRLPRVVNVAMALHWFSVFFCGLLWHCRLLVFALVTFSLLCAAVCCCVLLWFVLAC